DPRLTLPLLLIEEPAGQRNQMKTKLYAPWQKQSRRNEQQRKVRRDSLLPVRSQTENIPKRGQNYLRRTSECGLSAGRPCVRFGNNTRMPGSRSKTGIESLKTRTGRT